MSILINPIKPWAGMSHASSSPASRDSFSCICFSYGCMIPDRHRSRCRRCSQHASEPLQPECCGRGRVAPPIRRTSRSGWPCTKGTATHAEHRDVGPCCRGSSWGGRPPADPRRIEAPCRWSLQHRRRAMAGRRKSPALWEPSGP
jgi:hypothetical protein